MTMADHESYEKALEEFETSVELAVKSGSWQAIRNAIARLDAYREAQDEINREAPRG